MSKMYSCNPPSECFNRDMGYGGEITPLWKKRDLRIVRRLEIVVVTKNSIYFS